MRSSGTITKTLPSIFFLVSLVLIFWWGYRHLDYNWQWYRVGKYLSGSDGSYGLLVQGIFITLKISFFGLILSTFFGVFSALARLSSSRVLSFYMVLYIETIRNTPLLIQIFVIYFVISPVLDLSPMVCAVLALSLFEGAYASEIIRAGIVNVDKGQWEAARSIGLPTRLIYTRVVFPQVLKQTLPMLAGQSVSLIKDSALVSTISIFDLTMQGQRIVSETFLTFEIWFTVALCYFLMTAPLSFCIRIIEKRLNYTH
ncbi:MAG: amino acid ABC transporter permease [Desulfobacteraceae bacterium]|nr:MAG: amino acid ABC transporter permease [Desulfobacteraceae bacterium]